MSKKIQLQLPPHIAIVFMEAIQVIFREGLEYTEDDFTPLSEAQLDAYRKQAGDPPEKLYRLVRNEPTAVARTPEKVTLELNIVSESQKGQLLEGVRIIHELTRQLDSAQPTFHQRINHLIRGLPPEFDAQKHFPLFEE